jgi:hypothetical protein
MYKEFPLIQAFNKKLTELINYIDDSTTRVRIMEDKQMALEFENIYQLLKAKEIRWNSFSYSTNRVRKLFSAIYDSSNEFIRIAKNKNDEKEAIRMREEYILDFNFVYLMNWLSDFLQPICSLNKSLQEANYQLAKIKDDIETTIKILKADYTEFEKPPLYNPNNIHEDIPLDKMMQHHLRFGGFHLGLFLSNCTFINDRTVKYVYHEGKEASLHYSKLTAIELKFLVQKASTFFKDELSNLIPGEGNFFKNFQIFDFEDITRLKAQELSDYGNSEISALGKFYLDNDFDQDIILFEWKQLKQKLVTELKKDPIQNDKLKTKQYVSYFLSDPYFKTGYEGIIQIIEIYAVIPCSNAEVERGFSTMNRIKTKIRNRLLPENLKELMVIDLVGEDSVEWIKERIDEWFNYWNSNHNPRYIKN